MALWGNNDSKSVTGTIAITSGGAVTGTSTAFTTEVVVGDCISAANTDFFITAIASATSATVVAGGKPNATIAVIGAGNTYNVSTKPKYVAFADGTGLNSNQVYGVDTTEIAVSNGAVREVVITYAGTGYNANGAIAWTGGVGNTVAVADAANNTSNGAISATGRITSVRTANVGAGFTIGPVATVSAPAPITFNANTGVSTADATIALTTANSKFLVGDELTYTVSSGNTAVSPLVSGTTYFVSFANTTTIAIAATASSANLAIVKGLTETGHTIQGKTATVTAVLSGVRHSGHAGWVTRTVGTGGRAGRVTFETLVATGSIASDAEDSVMPDA